MVITTGLGVTARCLGVSDRKHLGAFGGYLLYDIVFFLSQWDIVLHFQIIRIDYRFTPFHFILFGLRLDSQVAYHSEMYGVTIEEPFEVYFNVGIGPTFP
jgi:hypothetical protein